MLTKCLRSLEAQTYPRDRFEIIVIDDGSTDNTQQFLAMFKRQSSSTFHFVTQRNRGPAVARNRGIALAGGVLVAFTDDDCVAERDWLNQLARGFESVPVAGIGGAIRTISRGVIGDYMAKHNVIASNLTGDSVPPFLITANACFRKDILAAVGGFDENFAHPGGEDPDLCWRILRTGGTLEKNPAAIVYHHPRQTLRQFYRMFYDYGWGHGYLMAKCPADTGPTRQRSKCAGLEVPRLVGHRVKRYLQESEGIVRAVLFVALDQVRTTAFARGRQQFERSPANHQDRT